MTALNDGVEPLVSVIIPTYNRTLVLRRALMSLCDQSFTNFEVIVVDDCSTENTEAVISEFSKLLRIHYLRLADNFGGPAKPRNAAMRMSKGKYLAFLDADDWWMPQKLSECIQVLDMGADIVYHDAYEFSDNDPSLSQRDKKGRLFCSRDIATPAFADLWIHGNGIINSSCCIRKIIADQAGEFCENKQLIAAEDYDYWLRVAKHTDKFVRLPKPLMFYSLSQDSISNLNNTLRYSLFLSERYEYASNILAIPDWLRVNLCIARFSKANWRIVYGLYCCVRLAKLGLIYRFLRAIVLIMNAFGFMPRRIYQFFALKKFKRTGSGNIVFPGSFTFNSISLGSRVYIGPEAFFWATKSEVFIGDDVTFGPRVSIFGGNHHFSEVGRYINEINEDEKPRSCDADVIVEDDCWIGASVIILKGVVIGEGSVIAAGSVVSRSIPPYSIVSGPSASVIKQRFTKMEIAKHKKIRAQISGIS